MQAVVCSHGVLVCVLVAWNVQLLALESGVWAPHQREHFVLFAPWSYLLYFWAWLFFVGGDYVRVNYCLCKESRLCGDACWSGQMVRLVRSWGEADGWGCFLHRKWQNKVPSCLSSFFPLSPSLSLNCSLHLSLPPSFSFAFPV